jgi:hypothetical protein
MAAKTPNRELIKEILAYQRSNERPKIISDTLAMMLMNMIENFAMKGNWRGYGHCPESAKRKRENSQRSPCGDTHAELRLTVGDGGG